MRAISKSDTITRIVICHRIVYDIVMRDKIKINSCFSIVVDLSIDDRIVMRQSTKGKAILFMIKWLNLIDRGIVCRSIKADSDIGSSLRVITIGNIFPIKVHILDNETAFICSIYEIRCVVIVLIDTDISWSYESNTIASKSKSISCSDKSIFSRTENVYRMWLQKVRRIRSAWIKSNYLKCSQWTSTIARSILCIHRSWAEILIDKRHLSCGSCGLCFSNIFVCVIIRSITSICV